MTSRKVREQIKLLESNKPMLRLQAVNVLGKMGNEIRTPGTVLGPADVDTSVRALARSLRDTESIIRAEAAWALGRIGNASAIRRLLYRLEENLPLSATGVLAPEPQNIVKNEPDDNALASLIAALGEGISEHILQQLDKEDLEILKRRQQALLEQIDQNPNKNLQVALIEMLVTLNIRVVRAGLEPFTDLTKLLCRSDSIAALAAITMLRETEPNAFLVAKQWYSQPRKRQQDPEITGLLENWRDHLGECAPDEQQLLVWLDMAAILWGMRDAAQVE